MCRWTRRVNIFWCFPFAGEHYQFRCLPFGLRSKNLFKSSGPSDRPSTAKQHTHIPLLERCSCSLQKSCCSTEQVLHSLTEFGWMVNLEKSKLDPSQTLVFLAMHFNTLQYRIFLPEDKVNCISVKTLQMSSPCITVQEFLRELNSLYPSGPMDTMAHKMISILPSEPVASRFPISEGYHCLSQTTFNGGAK